MTIKPGENIDFYQVIDCIGSGGMATVYKALDLRLGRFVAIKTIHPHLLAEPSFALRFEREAHTVANLRHAHILPVYAFGHDQTHGILYIVSMFANNGTLTELLSHHPLLPLAEIVTIVEQISDALEHAHDEGIVHRDIKPANILCDVTGQKTTHQRLNYYVADFGIALMLASSTQMATSSFGAGTAEYMAPEQAMGAEIDERMDIYALGIMLFQLLVGHVPFRGKTPLAISQAHLQQPLPDMRSIRPVLTQGLVDVVIKATQKDPRRRFTSVGELREAFRDAVREARDTLSPPQSVLLLGSSAPQRDFLASSFLTSGDAGDTKGPWQSPNNEPSLQDHEEELPTLFVNIKPAEDFKAESFADEDTPTIYAANDFTPTKAISHFGKLPAESKMDQSAEYQETPLLFPQPLNQPEVNSDPLPIDPPLTSATVLPSVKKNRFFPLLFGLLILTVCLLVFLFGPSDSLSQFLGLQTSSSPTKNPISPTSQIEVLPKVTLSSSPFVTPIPSLNPLLTDNQKLTVSPRLWQPQNLIFYTSTTKSCDSANQTNFTLGSTIYALIAMDNAPLNTEIDIVWHSPSATIEDNFKIDHDTNLFCFGFPFFLDRQNKNEIQAGSYHVDLIINQEKYKSLDFSVINS